MSVINRMLKDLDDRSQYQAMPKLQLAETAVVVKNSLWPALVGGVVIVAFVASGALLYSMWHERQGPSVLAHNPAAPSTASNESAVVAAPKPAVEQANGNAQASVNASSKTVAQTVAQPVPSPDASKNAAASAWLTPVTETQPTKVTSTDVAAAKPSAPVATAVDNKSPVNHASASLAQPNTNQAWVSSQTADNASEMGKPLKTDNRSDSSQLAAKPKPLPEDVVQKSAPSKKATAKATSSRPEQPTVSAKAPTVQLSLNDAAKLRKVIAQAKKQGLQPLPDGYEVDLGSPVKTMQTNQQRAENWYRDGVKYQQQDNLAAAMQAYDRALTLQPDHLDARERLLRCYLSLNLASRAEALIREGLVHYPEQQNWLLALANLQLSQGRYQEALLTLGDGRNANPNTEFWAIQGAAAQQVKEYQVALNAYRRLTQLEPEVAKWWMGLGIAQESVRDFNGARRSYYLAQQVGGLVPSSREFVQQRQQALEGK